MGGSAHVGADGALRRRLLHDRKLRDLIEIVSETYLGDGAYLLFVRSPRLPLGYHRGLTLSLDGPVPVFGPAKRP